MSRIGSKSLWAAAGALTIGILVVGSTSPVAAQDLSREEELLRRIEELEARVRALEATQEGDDEAEEPLPVEDALEEDVRPLVVGKHKNVELTLGGRIHRMVMFAEDTVETNGFFTDSDQGPTAIRLGVSGKPSEALTLGATLEVAIQQNRPLRVNQEDKNPGVDLYGRIAEITFSGPAFGKFSFGRGFAASWLSPEMDLSGTQFASLLPVGMLAPGMRFIDGSTGELSDVTVGVYFVDLERLLIQDRVRYDSPRFAGGLQLSGTVASDGRWDGALRAKYTPGNFTLVGGSSYANEPFQDIDRRFDGVISLRHEPTGINFTAGGAREEFGRGSDGTSWILKAGWLAELFTLGKTAFSIDYYRVNDIRFDGDQATSYGLFMVQKWPAYGIDFYTGIRRYVVDETALELEPLLVVPFGIAWNF